jgi:hypothetical protein
LLDSGGVLALKARAALALRFNAGSSLLPAQSLCRLVAHGSQAIPWLAVITASRSLRIAAVWSADGLVFATITRAKSSAASPCTAPAGHPLGHGM